MYKAFNTFIDDLFAFIITMPTAHRVACFRDDVCAQQSRATQSVSSEQAATSCFLYACVVSRLPAS